MTAIQFRAALDRLSLTQAQAAEALGVSIRTAHGYANGKPIPKPVELLLQRILTDPFNVLNRFLKTD